MLPELHKKYSKAVGRISVAANSRVADDAIIGKMFTKGDIEYKMIYDTDRADEIRYRSLGPILTLSKDAKVSSGGVYVKNV